VSARAHRRFEDPDEFGLPEPHRDTDQHASARISGRDASVHETTVWKLHDPRTARVRIYKSGEGLPWAICDLVKKTNVAIDDGEVPGRPLGPGDVVQAAVVSFYCDDQVHKPKTTDDSLGYATLPYRIVLAPEGYWTAEPALPAEALIHFHVPLIVGELIPGLTDHQRVAALVSMQLKEATYATQDDLMRREQYASPPVLSYKDVDTHGNDVFGYARFLEHDSDPQQHEVSGEWRNLTSFRGDGASTEQTADRAGRVFDERPPSEWRPGNAPDRGCEEA
jgi:hypothetical protein